MPIITYRLIAPRELDAPLVAAWRAIQQAHEHLASPYFCPEFTQLVAQVRSDVEILVLLQAATPVGFFPFQRARLGRGKPVAGPFSDYHGLIARPDLEVDLLALLRAAKLNTWEFDHVPARMACFAPHASVQATSPVIDLRGGFEAYLQRFKDSGSNYVTHAQRMARKLEREVGTLSFTFHDGSDAVVQQVIDWKDAQYLRTKVAAVFREHAWTGGLLRAITHTQSAHFSGVCSVLRANGQVVAAHLGMRSQGVLHWWFPTYDVTFEKYSPGTLLLLRMAEAAPEQGVHLIDLGKGDSRYKNTAMTGTIPLLEGTIERPSLITQWRTLERYVCEHATQGQAWARAANLPFRAWRRHERLSKFR